MAMMMIATTTETLAKTIFATNHDLLETTLLRLSRLLLTWNTWGGSSVPDGGSGSIIKFNTGSGAVWAVSGLV